MSHTTNYIHPAASRGCRYDISHWFNVTIFALLNGVLMWIYRKRSEVQLCET